MGTRSLTTFIDEPYKDKKGKTHRTKIVTIYRQMDGYPEGMGLDLAEFLAEGTVVNGLSYGEKKRVFNGMGCLAAQVVAHLKDGAGSIYLEKPRAADWEDYTYEIESNGEQKPLTFRCFEIHTKGRKKIFEGTPQDFIAKYKKEEVK